jgi:NADH-quinone oxidoreductase subunit I
MAIKVVERRPLTLAERTYLPQILAGLKVTWTTWSVHRSPSSIRTNVRPSRASYRGVPTLVMDPNGREKCVSCQLCEFVCPPKAIRITPGEIAEDSANAHVEKAPQEFEIDMLRCIYCGLCQEVCPEEAIWLQSAVFADRPTRAKPWSTTRRSSTNSAAPCPTTHHKWDKKKEAAERQAGGHH